MNHFTVEQLLHEYIECQSDRAFAELVRRHIDLVYSTAMRMVRDTHLAEDVAQEVFVALARDARRIKDRRLLSIWLYRTTNNLAARAIRSEVRRRDREHQAAAMNQLFNAGPDTIWEQVAPHLDAALSELNDPDRGAVLLRYFEGKSAREIARILGTSEGAAQRRVNRAVERLRECFVKRGLTVGTTGLTLAISAHAVQAAPVGLAATLTHTSLAAAAATGTGKTLTILKLMSLKLKLGLGALAIAAITASSLLVQQQAQVPLRQEIARLRQQVAQLSSENDTLSRRAASTKNGTPRLPAPAMQAVSASTEPPDLQTTNLFDRFKDKQMKLTPEQAELYLKANGRNAASLLAAYRTSGDAGLLAEAMHAYPNDPEVAFEAVFKKDAAPGERHQWLDALKTSDPGNALPNYLSALDYFKSGQTDQAVQELIAASAKPGFQDYTANRVQEDQEAFLAAGYSVAEAKTIPSRHLLLPQLRELKEVSLKLADLADSYRLAGDDPSAQAALKMAATLGQRYGNTPGETEISWLVGMAVEQIALRKMDPGSPYGNDGQTVQDRLNELTEKKAALNELNQKCEPLLAKLSDTDWVNYKDRWRAFGEEAALRWVVNKYESN